MGTESMFECAQCGKPTPRRAPSRAAKYCSPACYFASRVSKERKRGERLTVNCENCGTPMEILASQEGARKFCSHSCYAADKAGRPGIPYAKVDVRSCLVCGKNFEVGGRGRPPRRQRMCSDACQRASRYRHGAIAKGLGAMDAAYLAGIIDGEGSIILHLRDGKSVAMYLSVTNSSRAMLEWIKDKTGVGSICDQKQEGERNKATWFWRCSGDAAVSVIQQIRQCLVVKAVQADLALEVQQRLRDPALKADRSWQLECLEKMRARNKRGPAA